MEKTLWCVICYEQQLEIQGFWSLACLFTRVHVQVRSTPGITFLLLCFFLGELGLAIGKKNLYFLGLGGREGW